MSMNKKRGNSINSSIKIRGVTRKASSYQMIEESSSDGCRRCSSSAVVRNERKRIEDTTFCHLLITITGGKIFCTSWVFAFHAFSKPPALAF